MDALTDSSKRMVPPGAVHSNFNPDSTFNLVARQSPSPMSWSPTAPKASERRLGSQPVSPQMSRRAPTLSLQFTRTISLAIQNSPTFDSTPTSSIFTPLNEREDLDGDIIRLLDQAVRGPEMQSTLSHMFKVAQGQRVICVRRLSHELTDKWLLKEETVTRMVHILFKNWMWRNDESYDSVYLNLVYSILALCLIRGISPWPEKEERIAIYAQLSLLETFYYFKGLSTVLVRELVIATRPHDESHTAFTRAITDIAADHAQMFDHDALIRVLSKGVVLDDWIEKVVVIEEALRTPTDAFIKFIIDFVSVLAGVTSTRPEPLESTGCRLRDITTDLVDGTKLSCNGRREAFLIGLLYGLKGCISQSYSQKWRDDLHALGQDLLRRNCQSKLVFSLLDQLDDPPYTELKDIWPPPRDAQDDVSKLHRQSPVNKLTRSPMEIAEELTIASHKEILNSLRQLITCPLLQSPAEDMVNTSCGHYFSRRMIESWLARTAQCPLCRRTGVTIQGRCLWIDGVLDIISNCEQKFGRPSALNLRPELTVVVGIYISATTTVIGLKCLDSPEVSVLKDWTMESSFAIPSVVYIDSKTDAISGWGGDASVLESFQPCYERHVFGNATSKDIVSYFLLKLSIKVKAALRARLPDVKLLEDNVRYVFCLPDKSCPSQPNDLLYDDGMFSTGLRESSWNLSNITIVSETQCAALYAFDSNAGGIRRHHQVIHALSWDFYGISQHIYRLCPENDFGIEELRLSGLEAEQDLPISDEIAARIERSLQSGDSSLMDPDSLSVFSRLLRRSLRTNVVQDDLFECVPISKAKPPGQALELYTGSGYYYGENVYQDLLRLYFYAKRLSVHTGMSIEQNRDGSGYVVKELNRSGRRAIADENIMANEIEIGSNGIISIPSREIARCMNIAAIKALKSVPEIMANISPDDNITLVVFGPCADDSNLSHKLPAWIQSDVFSRRRPEGILTIGGSKSTTFAVVSDRMELQKDEVTTRSSCQIALDGLWIACKMVMAGEA